jgi:hypothetical protein
MNITKAEIGILAVLDLGDSALAAAKFGSQLRLSKTGGHPGDNKLVDEPSLGRELANGISHTAIAMSAEHLVDVAIGTPRCG